MFAEIDGNDSGGRTIGAAATAATGGMFGGGPSAGFNPFDNKKVEGSTATAATAALVQSINAGDILTSDPSFEILKKEFKLSDLDPKQLITEEASEHPISPVLLVDFADCYSHFPVQAKLQVDVNGVSMDNLLLGDQT